MNWIERQTILRGTIVDLIPMKEEQFEELDLLARESRIWEFIPVDMSSTKKRAEAFLHALSERERGTQVPFVILHKGENRIIGSTRLMDIQSNHKKLEIGWTWLHPDYWATAVNLECKLLLLTLCFEEYSAIRVQLKTDENNWRSRKAIEKIGGQYEGTLRHDMMRHNGTNRNSVYYSILDKEWETVKARLQALYTVKHLKK